MTRTNRLSAILLIIPIGNGGATAWGNVSFLNKHCSTQQAILFNTQALALPNPQTHLPAITKSNARITAAEWRSAAHLLRQHIEHNLAGNPLLSTVERAFDKALSAVLQMPTDGLRQKMAVVVEANQPFFSFRGLIRRLSSSLRLWYTLHEEGVELDDQLSNAESSLKWLLLALRSSYEGVLDVETGQVLHTSSLFTQTGAATPETPTDVLRGIVETLQVQLPFFSKTTEQQEDVERGIARLLQLHRIGERLTEFADDRYLERYLTGFVATLFTRYNPSEISMRLAGFIGITLNTVETAARWNPKQIEAHLEEAIQLLEAETPIGYLPGIPVVFENRSGVPDAKERIVQALKWIHERDWTLHDERFLQETEGIVAMPAEKGIAGRVEHFFMDRQIQIPFNPDTNTAGLAESMIHEDWHVRQARDPFWFELNSWEEEQGIPYHQGGAWMGDTPYRLWEEMIELEVHAQQSAFQLLELSASDPKEKYRIITELWRTCIEARNHVARIESERTTYSAAIAARLDEISAHWKELDARIEMNREALTQAFLISPEKEERQSGYWLMTLLLAWFGTLKENNQFTAEDQVRLETGLEPLWAALRAEPETDLRGLMERILERAREHRLDIPPIPIQGHNSHIQAAT